MSQAIKNSKLIDYSDQYCEEIKKTEMFLEAGSLEDINRIVDFFTTFVKKRGKNPNKLNLKFLSRGNNYTISYVNSLDDMPICIQFWYIEINDHIITCWYPTSQLVYYPLITDWFKKYFPNIILTDNVYELAKFCQDVFN